MCKRMSKEAYFLTAVMISRQRTLCSSVWLSFSEGNSRHGNKVSGSINIREILEEVRGFRLLSASDPCSCLLITRVHKSRETDFSTVEPHIFRSSVYNFLEVTLLTPKSFRLLLSFVSLTLSQNII